jgi:hypothetical protein
MEQSKAFWVLELNKKIRHIKEKIIVFFFFFFPLNLMSVLCFCQIKFEEKLSTFQYFTFYSKYLTGNIRSDSFSTHTSGIFKFQQKYFLTQWKIKIINLLILNNLVIIN